MILDHDQTRRPHSDRWHNDATYLNAPPGSAMLYAEVIPALGGDTLWSSMYQAYEELAEPLKGMLSSVRAIHSFAKNFTPERFDASGMHDRRDAMYAAHPPVAHPVVRTNPASGRRALFVNQDFTTQIEGMSPRQSDAILHMVYDHMARPEFQVRWRWHAGDLAFWDNRWAQHCALGDYFPQHRRVRRATIAGDVPV
jgi:taurine dioxygenase